MAFPSSAARPPGSIWPASMTRKVSLRGISVIKEMEREMSVREIAPTLPVPTFLVMRRAPMAFPSSAARGLELAPGSTRDRTTRATPIQALFTGPFREEMAKRWPN
jgi:hypothetical protein